MYAVINKEGRKILIVGGAGASASKIAERLNITPADIHTVSKDEFDEIISNEALFGRNTIKEIIHEIKSIERFEMPFIEPTKKPHHDRNVRRHSRKSRW